MTDEEFEKLLDQLHGSGNGPSAEELDAATKPAEAKPVAPQAAPKPQPAAPVAVKAEPTPSAPAKAEVKAPAKKQQAEATVRVDTSTLDTIMNMVGELVLVRNRLVRCCYCRPTRCGNEDSYATDQESIWSFPSSCP